MNIASTVLLADMWDTNGHMGGGWWIVMMLWMVLFWGAVIFGIVWLVRGGSPASWRAGRNETPLEILDRRFAEGAISVEEYDQRRETITGRADDQRNESGKQARQKGGMSDDGSSTAGSAERE
jgi:putative membrane protein